MSATALDDRALEFAPGLIAIERRPPAPLARWVLRGLLGFTALAITWALIGELDIIATAPGRLVPTSYLQIVQPAEAGIVKEILVREGDRVRKDQVLARMDTTLAAADAKSVDQEIAQRRLQLRRIDAELLGSPIARSAADAGTAAATMLFQQTLAQYHARRQATLDALATERATLRKAEQDLRAAIEIEAKLRHTLPIYEQQEAAWAQLAKEGFAGKLMALDKTKERLEREQEMRAQQATIEAARATIAQSNARLQGIESATRQQLQNERIDAQATLAKLEQDGAKLTHRQGLLELKAPEEGIVKDLATHTKGSVLQPGTVLMSVVPVHEPLQAEVWIGQDDAGFVRERQSAKLKLAAYPFQKYGLLQGAVKHVSPDASEGQGGNGSNTMANAANAASSKGTPQGGYRALVALEATELITHDGKHFALQPGMQLTAEINLGTRTIMEYLLSPVQKTVREAGRER